MFIKHTKLIVLFFIFITVVIYFIINKKPICNDEYWENSKATKQIQNIEICIKEGNVEAAVLLSRMYANGDTTQTNHAKAVETIENFAKSGHGKAMIQMGNLYSCYRDYSDYDKAEEWYNKAINNHCEEAKISLAYFYIRRYSQTNDHKYIDLYLKWLTKIANEGNADAMRLLADEYKNGDYLTQNYNISLEWLKKASLKGDVLAYRAVGNYYVNGFFGDANYNEARSWFQKAANIGDDIAAGFLKDNPAPLGLEITKSTVSDFKEKFKHHTKVDSPNFINGGYTYLVNPKYIPIDGVKDNVAFVFDKNLILESVLIVLDKDKYSEVQTHLQSKYTPFIDGSKTFFTQGITYIELTEEYTFYSALFTDRYKSDVFTLIYQSRAFYSKLSDKIKSFIKQNEIKRKQKMNEL